ncbi:LysR family transcriptional regulator [Poseidonocella sp. HB161398]|uniref:LysR family transcriptional regulator n=1 Tax=Poseidonocella sp. HB161398 TaxID=2320855 RepID=UPI0011096977|nr:LysR family transcriptional regulator [Poseidonocella sp. HB161398]
MVLERRHLPDLKLLQTFECAARHRNFTRAGEELSLTQSAVSRQIRELEAQLGRTLFERIRGRVVPTPSGEVLRGQAARLLQLAESTLRHASAEPEPGRMLRLNAPATFATRWLMPRLAGFLGERPGLRIDLSTRGGVFDMGDAGCDLAVHFGHPVWPGGRCTYLCSEVVLPVAGGALARTALRGPADLAEAPKLHVGERPDLWPGWFARADVEPAHPREGHWFDQFAPAIEAARAGLGHALLPRYLIEEELAQGALSVMLDMPMATEMAYYIVAPEGRPEAGAELRQWLLSQVSFRPLAR